MTPEFFELGFLLFKQCLPINLRVIYKNDPSNPNDPNDPRICFNLLVKFSHIHVNRNDPRILSASFLPYKQCFPRHIGVI